MLKPEAFTHLMLLPTLDCPGSCSYCFGPNSGGTIMSRETLQAVVHWLQHNNIDQPLEITFHGGEPLLPGEDFFRMALPLLRHNLTTRKVGFGMQSNLWPLTPDLCELLKQFQVSLGTSLDGPQEINNAQRGEGCFQKTMQGIRLAREHGMDVGCICTFTARSATQAEMIFEFFLKQNLGFSIHAALPSLGHANDELVLSPEEYAQLMITLLNLYLENISQLRISTLDSMARSISAGKAGICTFTDCLGHYLAVDPDGWIYPCQRMAGLAAYRLGNVHDAPSLEDLQQAPIWITMQSRQE